MDKKCVIVILTRTISKYQQLWLCYRAGSYLLVSHHPDPDSILGHYIYKIYDGQTGIRTDLFLQTLRPYPVSIVPPIPPYLHFSHKQLTLYKVERLTA